MKPKTYKLIISVSVVVFVLFLAMPFALADGTLTYTWDNATHNDDGSEIPATGDQALAETVVEYSICNSNDKPRLTRSSITVTPDLLTATTPTIPDGRYCAEAFHINNAGIKSGPSNVSIKVLNSVAPLPPGGLSSTADLLVWNFSKIDDGLVLTVIGKVPEGTPCDPSQSINGMYVVPTDAVVWDGSNRAPVVVARCM